MSKSYDIFLSHSGAQKEFVEQLYTELTRQYGHYSVFFDKDSIKYGEQISSIILEYTKTCKLLVAVLSEEYLTRSRPPMMELAASYTAKKDGSGLPCLLPVFFKLKPEHAKNYERQTEWYKTWEEWELNEIMSERFEVRTNKVQLKVWKEALSKLLDTRGPIYKPHENRNKSAVFSKEVARVIASKLDEMSETVVPYKVEESVQQYKATNRSDSVSMEHLSKDLNRMNMYANTPHFDQMEEAPSVESHMEAVGVESSMKFERTCFEPAEREENVAERERNVTVRERNVTEREMNVTERERNITERERNVKVRENNASVRENNASVREHNASVRENLFVKR